MTGLTLTLREMPPERVDLSALVPGRLSELDAAAIARLDCGTGRERITIGDLFGIGMGDPHDIRIEGGSDRLDGVGQGLAGGRIQVEGAVGAMLGRGMTAGEIVVGGSAGPYAGSSMAGGRIEIAGDAGERLGGPPTGGGRGVAGGVLLLRGSAGARAGERMRRGLIVVGGGCGPLAGFRMTAGTLVVGGAAGPGTGTLMQRGTLVIAGGASLAPTFIPTGGRDLVALRLLSRAVEAAGGAPLPRSLRRYAGDTAVLGKGEVFLPADR